MQMIKQINAAEHYYHRYQFNETENSYFKLDISH